MLLIKWTLASMVGLASAGAYAHEPTIAGDCLGSTGEVVLSQPVKTGNGVVMVISNDGVDFSRDADNSGINISPEMRAQLRRASDREDSVRLVAEEIKREKGAYLGISASAPPSALRKQLGLARGTGLVVDFVVPDSPAAKSGIEQFDVIQKLDDQIIINPSQLAILVRSHKVGDEVKLGIIHEGKPTTVSLKLVEHELEPLAEDIEGDNPMAHLHGLPPDMRINRPGHDGGPWNAGNMPLANTTGSVTWIENGESCSIVADAQGHKNFTCSDKDGKVIFQGLIDTKEQLDKLPPEQKQKLERLKQHIPAGAMHSFFEPAAAATQPAEPAKEGEKK